MQSVKIDSPDWPKWVAEQQRLSAVAPTFYANRYLGATGQAP